MYCQYLLKTSFPITRSQIRGNPVEKDIYIYMQNTTNAVYLSSMAVQTTEEKEFEDERLLEMSQEFWRKLLSHK